MDKKLRAALAEVEMQIEAVKQTTQVPEGYTIYHMRYPNGQYVLENLLAAKAYLLAAIQRVNGSARVTFTNTQDRSI